MSRKNLPILRILSIASGVSAVVILLVFLFLYAPSLIWLAFIKSALSQYDNGHFEQAEHTLVEGLKIARYVPGDRKSFLQAVSLLAGVYLAEGRGDDARASSAEIVAIVTKDEGSQSMALIAALNGLAHSYRIQARYKEAEKYYLQAVAIADANHQTSKELATVLSQLSKLYVYQGRFTEAEAMINRLKKVYEQNFSKDDEKCADLIGDESDLEEGRGHYGTAEKLATKALSWRQARAGASSPEVAKSLIQISSLSINAGQLEQASKPAIEAKRIFDTGMAKGAEAYTKTLALTNLALVETLQNDLSNAEKTAVAAQKAALAVVSDRHPYYNNILVVLAMVKRKQGHLEEAKSLLQQALKAYEEALGPNNRLIARAQGELAANCVAEHKYEKAEELYKQAIKVSNSFFCGPHPSAATIWRGYADLLDHQGRKADAEHFRTEATKVLASAKNT
jgi:tetratricopeptide (TPR) repeat protein